MAFLESFPDFAQLEVNDRFEVLSRQSVEDDEIIDAIEEFRSELLLSPRHDHVFHFVVADILGSLRESESGLVLDRLGTDIGRHDDDRVFEVDAVTIAVGRPSFFHDLEEETEDVGVSFSISSSKTTE